MEYRRRKRIRRATCRRGVVRVSPTLLAAIGVFCAAFYLIAGSRFGTYASERWLIPLFRSKEVLSVREETEGVGEEQAETGIGTSRTETVVLGPVSFYTIQLGAFEKRENAEQQAERLRAQGAAGYVLEDGGLFRVLAACYETNDDAIQVREQLAQQNVTSRIHVLHGARRTITVTADDKTANRLCEAVNGVPAYLHTFYEAVNGFDRDKTEVSETAAKLKAIAEAVQGAAELFDAVEGDEAEAFCALADELTRILTRERTDAMARTEHSAQLKADYLEAVLCFLRYTASESCTN